MRATQKQLQRVIPDITHLQCDDGMGTAEHLGLTRGYKITKQGREIAGECHSLSAGRMLL